MYDKPIKGDYTDDLRVTMRRSESLCEAFSGAESTTDLCELLERELSDSGFPLYAYRGMNFGDLRSAPFFSSNYPSDWLHHYQDRQYILVDPVPSACSNERLPFRWGADETVGAITQAQREFFEEATSAGIRSGIAIPVHGAGAEFSMLSVTSTGDAKEFRSLCTEYGDWLHMVALYFHDALSRRLAREAGKEQVHLTPRERECLLWTAKGKTAWEIAVILSISDGTVVFHLKNAIKKLGVNNKQHAVVAAIMRNLIQP